MKERMRKKYRPAKQPCWQEDEIDDCFALNRFGNCDVLTDTEYPCGKCPFYKSRKVFEDECRHSYRRLIALERMDLICKYEIRDQGLSGSWQESCGRRRR